MLFSEITDRRKALVKAYERMGVPHHYSASVTDPIILGIFSVAAVRRQLNFSEIKTGNTDFETDGCAP